MKKAIFITLALLISVAMFAQRTTYHEGTFDNIKIGTGTATTLTATTLNATTFSPSTISFSGKTFTKAINFTGSTMTPGAASAAWAYGTWSTPIYVKPATLSGHYVPIQVNLHTSTSGAYDVAAARFRVDADADTACTSTFVNVIEGRSALYGTVAGHAGFNMSTNFAGNTTVTGDGVAIVAKIEGSGNVTSSNHITPFYSTVVATGSGIDDVGYFDANGCTVTDVVKLETHNSATTTNMLNVANTSGTATNGINVTGTYSGKAITTTGEVGANYFVLTGTDTVTAAPVGSLVYKSADSCLYFKIRATGTTGARWIKIAR